MDPNQQVVLELYQDPTLTLGPGIVRSILNQLMDNFSGAKIAVGVAMAQSQEVETILAGKVFQQYMAASAAQSRSRMLSLKRAPPQKQKSPPAP